MLNDPQKADVPSDANAVSLTFTSDACLAGFELAPIDVFTRPDGSMYAVSHTPVNIGKLRVTVGTGRPPA